MQRFYRENRNEEINIITNHNVVSTDPDLPLNINFQVDEVRGTITVKDPNARKDEPPKQFTFDTVFAPNCKQVDVYNQVARPIVESVLEGYNGKYNPVFVKFV